jgi:hypothetical protein
MSFLMALIAFLVVLTFIQATDAHEQAKKNSYRLAELIISVNAARQEIKGDER